MSAIREHMEKGQAYFLERADRDIERYRKGDFTVTLKKNGKPVSAGVRYALTRIDYDFGCNLFMLDQYDDADMQSRYLELWKNLFNTAVVPLYWEGTEPERGVLRYDRNAPNDVYRRPPAARVLDFCRENGIRPKGHPLFWHEFIPRWLPADWGQLLPLIEKRFREISARFGDEIPVFDCVNEPSRIFDMGYEHATDGYKMVAPPNGYIEQVFALAEKYFPKSELILNEATGFAVCEYKGIYGGYYQLIERLLKEGCRIDRIGLQCHVSDDPVFKNYYDARRLYGVLDGYAALGKPLVVSEIGLSTEDEELQAEAARQIYKVCFSVPATSGVFWWNLDDTGIIRDKTRLAMAENLPYGGLARNGAKKAAYRALDELINREWTTAGAASVTDGKLSFRGFYGTYAITVDGRTFAVDFGKSQNRNAVLEL